MARLLAAEFACPSEDLFEHITVSHLGADKVDPALTQRYLKSQVAHHRRYDQITRKPARRFHVARKDQHHLVTIDLQTASIHKECSVRVAVEGYTEVESLIDNQTLKSLLMERSAAFVDVLSIRRGGNHFDSRSESLEDAGSDERSCAIRAIEADSHAIKRQPATYFAHRYSGTATDTGTRTGCVSGVAIVPARRTV